MHIKKRIAGLQARLRRTGIRTRLLLVLWGVVLFVLLLVWGLSAHLLQPRYDRHIKDRLTTRLEQLAGYMDAAIQDGVVISRRGVLGVEHNQAFWAGVNADIQSGVLDLTNCCVDISDATGFGVTHSENLYPCLLHESSRRGFGGTTIGPSDQDTAAAIRLRQQCFAQGTLYHITETASGSRQMTVGRTTADGSYCVLLSASLAQVEEAAKVMGVLLPGIAAVLGFWAFGVAWVFSLWFTRPLTQLSDAAKEMARGNYQVRVPACRQDEIGVLSREFNNMARQVNRAHQLQKDLMANVTHDLRTPLTLIKGYAETVRDLTGADKSRRDDQLNIIIDETDRLTGLVNSVMELSKVSSGAEKCEPVQFDVRQLCEEVAERYEGVCRQNGWALQLQLPAVPLNVWADPGMIGRVLHNLLGNAIHHMGEDGIFVLRAAACPGGVRVEVEDHGPGIPSEELPYLFDRYYRSRSDAGKRGAGLGLSITKAILQQHGARFGVESTLGKGSVFWFILPQGPGEA